MYPSAILRNFFGNLGFLFISVERVSNLGPISIFGPEYLDFCLQSLHKFCPNPLFVQIGANDGVRDDYFGDLVAKYHLRGLMVEPLPEPFARLQRKYANNLKIQCINSAVGKKVGKLNLYSFDCERQGEIQLSVFTSVNKSHLTKWKRTLGIEANIVHRHFPSTTVGTLLRNANTDTCEILIVDCEGHDGAIVHSTLDQNILPKIIVYESTNMGHVENFDLMLRLRSLRYSIVQLGTDNRLAVYYTDVFGTS